MRGSNVASAIDVLALITSNTGEPKKPKGPRKRPHALPVIAEAIRAAVAHYGSLAKVASRVGISTEMLGRFLSAEKLHPEVRPLVKNRRIDSLNMVHYMAALPHDDQPAVAKAILAGKLTGTDVRALAPLRRRYPGTGISRLIDRVAKSRNTRVYVIVLPRTDKSRVRHVHERLARIAGNDEVSLRSEGSDRYAAVLTRLGLENVRRAATGSGLSLREFVSQLLEASDAC
jgi:DNA-binding phage protein